MTEVLNRSCLSSLPLLLLLLLCHGQAAAASHSPADISAASEYTVEQIHIAKNSPSCIPALLYLPGKPLTDPPGLVVMVPTFGQHALQPGLHQYAHVYASNGLAVLVMSAPGALAEPLDNRARQTLLRCSQQLWQLDNGIAPRSHTFDRQYRKIVYSYVEELTKQKRVDAARIAYWGADWGAAVAVQAGVESPGRVQAIILQVRDHFKYLLCCSLCLCCS